MHPSKTVIELRNIETFYCIATLGGFRATAKKLHTSQPAVSQRIAQLEQALGASSHSADAGDSNGCPAGSQLFSSAAVAAFTPSRNRNRYDGPHQRQPLQHECEQRTDCKRRQKHRPAPRVGHVQHPNPDPGRQPDRRDP